MRQRNESPDFTTVIEPDGGWEEAVDSGEGLEDLLLGPSHPYDRSDGYTPDSRWGTRHELQSRRFSDVPDSTPAPRIVQSSGANRRATAPARITHSGQRRGAPGSKRERRAVAVAQAARELGITAEQVSAAVFTSDSAAQAAQAIGMSETQVRKARSVYTKAMERLRAGAGRDPRVVCSGSPVRAATRTSTSSGGGRDRSAGAVRTGRRADRLGICGPCGLCISGTACRCS
jgi:hypothetical protein